MRRIWNLDRMPSNAIINPTHNAETRLERLFSNGFWISVPFAFTWYCTIDHVQHTANPRKWIVRKASIMDDHNKGARARSLIYDITRSRGDIGGYILLLANTQVVACKVFEIWRILTHTHSCIESSIGLTCNLPFCYQICPTNQSRLWAALLPLSSHARQMLKNCPIGWRRYVRTPASQSIPRDRFCT